MMDRHQKDVIQRNFSFLVDHVDPRHIIADIFRRKGMSRQLMQRIHNDEGRIHRAEVFFMEVVDTCPFHVLINSLRYTKHRFVAQKLLKAYQPIILERNSSQNTTQQIDTRKSSDLAQQNGLSIQNEEYVYVYEELRSYRDNGDIDTLERRVSSIVWKWESDYKARQPSAEKSCIAQLAIEAKLAWFRFLIEAGRPCDVLAHVHDIGSFIIHTVNPILSTVMILAVQTQLLVYPKGYMEDTLDKYNGIKLLSASLPLNAIHLVNVYVAEFFIDCMSYELTAKHELKDKICSSLDQIMDRFVNVTSANEAEKRFRLGFIRRSLVVKALLCLNMTSCGRLISGLVPRSDLASAKDALQRVFSDWDKMDKKWKMMYHVAQARLQMSEGNNRCALTQAEHAQALSDQLYHCEERRNVTQLLQDLRHTQND
ncbi:uncharacterized protein LOC110450120 [Mizuhopecten yessoensis]|uniref:uncharacterized protein LOC110450120 n=1 Tax=Mizuhopecten yessoensis TaxID=6573 RepID=UPI000B45D911|nr:uncharacterized protein LOC110450120 [Mizuhopecten yessoensis]XP_021353063.1 uncharacterized protein LOC110450120 [Mizuhopecten yessoensis]